MKTFSIPGIIKFSNLMVLMLIIISCGPTSTGIDIQPKLPELTSSNKLQPEPSESILNLPVKIPLAKIQKALNQEIPSYFSGTEADPTNLLSNDNLTYNINRKNLSIGTQNNKITFSIPVSGTARVKGKINLRLTKIPVSGHTDFAGTIFGDISLGIDNQWNIKPNINVSTNFTKAEIPIKRIGKISIRSKLQKELDKLISKEKPKLITEFVKQLNFKEEVTKQWDKLHLLKQVNKDPSIWIKTEPQSINFKQFDLSDGQNIQSGIGIKTVVDTCICEKTSPPKLKPLPNLTIQNQINDKFLINLPVQASLEELNKTLQSQVNGQSFSLDKNIKLIVNDINLSALGEKILVKVDFNADQDNILTKAKGVLYLWGQISYDKVSNTLKIVQLDYDINTKNKLLSAANWLLKPTLLEKIQDRLSFPLEQQLERAKGSVNEYINNIEMPSEIDAKIKVNAIQLEKVIVNNNNIYLILLADGNMSAALNLGE